MSNQQPEKLGEHEKRLAEGKTAPLTEQPMKIESEAPEEGPMAKPKPASAAPSKPKAKAQTSHAHVKRSRR